MRPPFGSPPAPARRLPISLLIGAVAVLYFGKEVLVPLALALLFSFLLGPLVRRVEHIGLRRVPAVLAVTALFLCLFGLVGWLVTHQVIDLAAKASSYQDNIQRKIQALQAKGGTVKTIAKVIDNVQKQAAEEPPQQPEAKAPAKDREERAANEITKAAVPEKAPMEVRVVEPPASPPQFLRNVLGPLLAPLAMAGVVVLFTIFMLIQREDLRDRLLHLAGPQRLTITTQAVDDAGRRISRYLLMQVIVNLSFGTAIGLGLMLIHVPNAILWGLLAGICRFVPYIGPWIGALFPTLLSLAAFQSWQPVLLTFGLFVVVELIVGNAVEPWLYGSSTGLSPVAIIVAATFWTWLWGGVGLLLSTPLTVCIVVLGRYVPQLEFLNTLLGDEEVVPLDTKLYQRLLALDQEEASDLIDEHLKTHSPVEFYDQVFIPALNQAQTDSHLGNLSEDRQMFITQTAHTLIEDLRERPLTVLDADPSEPPPVQDAIAGPPLVSTLILPVKTEMDEIAGEALAHLLALDGIGAEVLSPKALLNEMIAAIGERKINSVCISSLRPFAVMQARHMVKRLRARYPQLKIVIGLWDPKKPSAGARRNLQSTPADCLASTLAEAGQHIRQTLQRLSPEEQSSTPSLTEPSSLEKAQSLVEEKR